MESVIYLSKSAAILALFYIVYIAVLRNDTFFTANRHYLLSGIIAAIVFPFIQFTKTIYVELPSKTAVSFSDAASMSPLQIIPDTTSEINWWYVAALIYGIGVSVMLIRFVRQLYSLLNLLKKYPSEKIDGYTYIKVSKKSAPFSFFRYIVYNPSMHSQEELSMILKHEQIHGAQWHSIDIMAANLLLILQWVNPLAWFYKKGIEENLEFIADSATVQQVPSIKQYQLALVKASSTLPIPALTTNFYQSFIKKRILMLNKSTSNKINVWKLSIVLPLLALFLWSFNVNEVVSYTEKLPDLYDASEVSISTLEVTPIEGYEIAENLNTNLSSERTTDINTVPSETALEDSNTVLNTIPSEVKNSGLMVLQDILVTITKDTTEEELKGLIQKLKTKGFTLKYSNLEYNTEGEITAISITYKDAQGSSGNYSINSDKAINPIVIKSNGDKISIGNTGHNYAYSYNDEKHDVVRNMKRKEMEIRRMEERKGEMKERMVEMEGRKKEMKERQVEMKVRRNEMNNKMKEERKILHEERRHHREEMKGENILIIEGDSDDVHVLHDSDTDGLIEIREIHHGDADDIVRVERIHKGNDLHKVRSHNALFADDIKRITKHTSKGDLDAIKSEFKKAGVSFSYSSLKRNEAGEITKIKLKLNNNKGSSSTSTYKNDGRGIKPIFVGVNEGTTIMTSKLH